MTKTKIREEIIEILKDSVEDADFGLVGWERVAWGGAVVPELLELFCSWVLEMIDLLDEFSRIEITHKDGSKSIAILESQIETWKKVVKEKVGE